MKQTSDKFDISHLTPHERLDLIGVLWDSIAHDSQISKEVLPLTEAQKHELDSRLAAEERGEITYSSWDEVKHRLLAEKK